MGIVGAEVMGIGWSLWLCGLAAALFGAIVCRGRGRVVGLLAVWTVLGGLRYLAAQQTFGAGDISQFAPVDHARPVRLRGIVLAEPRLKVFKPSDGRAAWLDSEQTDLVLSCTQLYENRGWRDVAGKALVRVGGNASSIEVGDRLEVLGSFSRPGGKRNPGGFDYRAYLLRDRIGCVVTGELPATLTVRGRQSSILWKLRLLRSRLRLGCRRLFAEQLSPRTAPLATAMLIGDRTGLDEETRVGFRESGTMHLLAISGLHVGILAGFLYVAGRVLSLPATGLAAFLIVGVVAYAFVTDARPPVVRATVLVVVGALGLPLNRRALSMNTLALSAILILLWRPSDLFEAGTQLSFLAVMAILWTGPWRERVMSRHREFQRSALGEQRSRLRRLWDAITVRAKCGYGVTAAIALFTTPLVAMKYHLFAPIGIVINVLLVFVVGVALWCGYGMLFVGLVWPLAARPFSWLCDVLLSGLLWVVRLAQGTPAGHVYVPTISGWWLGGYYVLLACMMMRWAPRRRIWAALGVWSIVGLAVWFFPRDRRELRCTFLSMGHGCAVLLEFPDGADVLYDAGGLFDARRAAENVLQAVWSRNKVGLSAVIVSHADADHFNAVPRLLRTLPVGRVLAHRTLLGSKQKGIRELRAAAMNHDIPLERVQGGERITVGGETIVRVLQPGAGEDFGSDNANSLVVLIECRERRILLTGDLEKEGLDELLSNPIGPIDVLMAPHHGSKSANDKRFAAWSRPRWVIVSGGDAETRLQLEKAYGQGASVMTTREQGAVTVRITAGGEMVVE